MRDKSNAWAIIGEHRRVLWFLFFFAVATTTESQAQKPERIRHVTAAGDLQGVLDDASPGDIITLAPGIYYGLFVINKGGDVRAPVVVRAEEPGTVTFTNATRPRFDLEFAPEYANERRRHRC